MARLAWIGLGRLGAPCATRLATHGHELSVWDIDPEALKRVAASGARAATSVADASRNADGIFLCLTSEAIIEQVAFGADGIASVARKGAVIVDHSTVAPATAVGFSRQARDRGLTWVDVPVSGGPTGAAAGSLISWLGGEPKDLDHVERWISAYVVKSTRMGGVGSGQQAKSCNQIIMTATVALWSQTIRYARAIGLNAEDLVRSLEGGATDSPVSRDFARTLVAERVSIRSINNQSKDLKIVLDLAQQAGVDVPMARAALAEILSIKPYDASAKDGRHN